jgi:Holliday junction resolvase RusA-like endonuclease
MTRIAFTLFGEAASKANSRMLVMLGDRPASIKSKKARTFEHDAVRQIPTWARQRLVGPVRVTLRIFYTSERPDLDESVVLDVLQDRWSREKVDKLTGQVYVPRALVQAGVYRNDRQVREKHIYWGLDRVNPRVEIVVEPVHAQQAELALDHEACEPLPF